jgi:hypothetical protein
MSTRILQDKRENLARAGAQAVAGGNQGGLLQIEMGLRMRDLSIRAVHPIELLDEGYRKGDGSNQKTQPRITRNQQAKSKL